MSPFELTTFINTTANAIACNMSDDELNLLSTVFSQLGDTLATISVQRSICTNSNSTKK